MIFQKYCKPLNKIKVFKKDCQKILPTIQGMKKPGTTYCLGYKYYADNFKPQEIKMTNKVLGEK